MGSIIRNTAATEDIVADAKTTLTNARAKGGDWATLAEERLTSAITLFDGVVAQIAEARRLIAGPVAALSVADDRSDALLGNISDTAWNAIGRPAHDAAFSVLFPSGIGYYTDGDVAEQPERMEVLATLLESSVHPRLPKELAQKLAGDVRAEAALLQVAVDAVRQPRARLTSLERVKTALGRAAYSELSNLKRLYKAKGFSEAEIHAVIPDRPREAAKKAPLPAPVL